MAKRKITESSEIKRLTEIYKKLPSDKFALAQGLIVQAARMRVMLDKLWADIEEHGQTEIFTQSEKTEPYMRERPASKLFQSTNKDYQNLIKQLNEMAPKSNPENKLQKMMNDG